MKETLKVILFIFYFLTISQSKIFRLQFEALFFLIRKDALSDHTYYFGLEFITEFGQNYISRLYANFAAFLAIFLIFHIYAIVAQRFIHGKIVGKEPKYIAILNKIVQNTIEQALIFGCLLFANLQYNGMNWSPLVYINFVRYFTFSRILFSIGYLFGQSIDRPGIRSIGFIGTNACNFGLLSGFFGMNVFKTSNQIGFPAGYL